MHCVSKQLVGSRRDVNQLRPPLPSEPSRMAAAEYETTSLAGLVPGLLDQIKYDPISSNARSANDHLGRP